MAQLTKKRHEAVVAILSTSSIEEASEKCGVATRTLYRWLREDEDFKQAFKEARREIISRAIAHLQRATVEAVQMLRDVAGEEANPPSSRVSASRTILEYAFKAMEIEDIEERLNALEERMKADG